MIRCSGTRGHAKRRRKGRLTNLSTTVQEAVDAEAKSRTKRQKRVLALPDLEHAKTAVLNSLMTLLMNQRTLVVAASLATALSGATAAGQATQIAGVPCVSRPPLHCPDADCPPELIADRGNTVLPKSNRAFFLDYPCNLKPGEAVTFILSLHGGAMIGNWQRHYFPLLDLKDKYRLVVATPSAVNSLWNVENDDAQLRNIVNFVYEQIGAKNVKAFWLVGHSQDTRSPKLVSRHADLFT